MTEPVQKSETRGIMNRMREQTHIVLWILVFSFVGLIVFEWGMDIVGLRSPSNQGTIGEVNNQEITYQAFWDNVQRQFALLRDRFGTAPDEQTMRTVRDQVFNEMVNAILVQAAVENMGFAATDAEVIQEVYNRPRPEFLNNPDFSTEDGKFDKNKYETVLRQLAQMNAADIRFLDADARSHIPEYKLRNTIGATVRVTDNELKQQFIKDELTATVEYVQIEYNRFADSEIDITEEDINQYYRTNSDNFYQEETRQIQYALFNAQPTNSDSAATDAQIQEALERAQSGEEFAELAVEYSDSDGNLGTFAKGAMVPAFEEAVFSNNVREGDIIGPVDTQFGRHIIKVERLVTRRGAVDSVEAKHMLFTYTASASTLEKVEYDARYFVISAREDGFESAANANELTISSTLPFSDNDFIPGFGTNPEISSFIFASVYADDNQPISEVIETPAGFAVLQLIAVNESHTKALNDDNVRFIIEQNIRTEKQQIMTLNLLAIIKATIDSNTSFADAVSNENLTIETTNPFKLNDYLLGVGTEIQFTSTAFELDAGEVSRPVAGNNGGYLIRLIEKDEFDAELFAQQKSTLTSRLYQRKIDQTFGAWMQQQRDNADIKDYRSKFFTR